MFTLKFLGSSNGRWARGIVGAGLLVLPGGTARAHADHRAEVTSILRGGSRQLGDLAGLVEGGTCSNH